MRFFERHQALAIICVIILIFFFPHDVDNIDLPSGRITLYNAYFYSVVRVEVLGFTRCKLYLFPSNLDVKNNINAFFNYTEGTLLPLNNASFKFIQELP